MSKHESNHMSIVAQVGCVLCRRDTGQKVACHVHHIAEGSGERSDFMTAGLCYDHHNGVVGIHGMGVKQFLRLHRLPTEYHLLELVNEYRAKDGI